MDFPFKISHIRISLARFHMCCTWAKKDKWFCVHVCVTKWLTNINFPISKRQTMSKRDFSFRCACVLRTNINYKVQTTICIKTHHISVHVYMYMRLSNVLLYRNEEFGFWVEWNGYLVGTWHVCTLYSWKKQ